MTIIILRRRGFVIPCFRICFRILQSESYFYPDFKSLSSQGICNPLFPESRIHSYPLFRHRGFVIPCFRILGPFGFNYVDC